MKINTEGLRSLKITKEPLDTPKLSLDQLQEGHLVAFDPSLAATGVVGLVHEDGKMRVEFTHTFKGTAPEKATGHAKDTAEALDLLQITCRLFGTLLDEVGGDYDQFPWFAAREAPPVGGGRLVRPESSIQAGLMVEVACREMGVSMLPMIYVAKHRATICQGKLPGKLTKAAYHKEWLMPLAEELEIENLDLISNESHRDALAVGLTAFAREKW